MEKSNSLKSGVKTYFETENAVSLWETLYADSKNFFSYAMLARRKNAVTELYKRINNTDKKIADVGCGSGLVSKDLLSLGYDVTGVDLSEEMLQNASKIDGLKLLTGDVEHLPFESQSLDGIICLGVISYLPDESAALAELHRVLKPGGTLVLAVRNSWEMGVKWDILLQFRRACGKLIRKMLGQPQNSQSKEYYHRTFVPSELKKNVISSHFELNKSVGCGFEIPPIMQKRLLPTKLSIRFSQLIEKTSKLLPFRFMNNFGLVYMIVATRLQNENQ